MELMFWQGPFVKPRVNVKQMFVCSQTFKSYLSPSLLLCHCSFPQRQLKQTLPVNWLKKVKRLFVKRWVFLNNVWSNSVSISSTKISTTWPIWIFNAFSIQKFIWCYIFCSLFSFVCMWLTQMSQFIVQCLNPYRKPDCKLGRISNTEDFKHLARKVRLSK